MQDSVDRDGLYRRRGLGRRFAPAIEAGYRQFHDAQLLTRARWSSLAAMLVMLAYGALDLVVLPPVLREQTLALRTGLMVLPLGLGFAATFVGAWQRFMPWLAGAVALLVGLSVALLVVLARLHGAPIQYEGLLLTLIYIYCCGGLRLSMAVVVGLLTTLFYVLGEAYAGLKPSALTVRTSFLLTANVIGVIGAWLMGEDARRNYVAGLRLKHLAEADHLTGLLNRRAFNQRMDVIWGQARRERQPLAVALLDVDHFKRYNDHYGHLAGDEVLAQVGRVIGHHGRRPLDLAVRYGGEEFLCVWYGVDRDTVQTLLATLRDRLVALDIPHAGAPGRGRVSLSVGVWCGVPAPGQSMQDALHAADMALYQAKAEGRDRWVMAGAADGSTGTP